MARKRQAWATRSCYFRERFRCNACGALVQNIHERPCALPPAQCGFAQSWYGHPSPADETAQPTTSFRSQLWRFLLAMAFFVGVFGLSWVRWKVG